MILSVDIGTSILKCGIFDRSCRLINSASEPVKLNHKNSFYETDPSEWINAFKKNCSIMPEMSKIKTIVISGNGPTLLAIDNSGKTLYPAISWMDKRGAYETRNIFKGSNINPTYFLSKVYWIYKNKPQVYSQTSSFISCPEYLVYYLTGNPFTILPNKEFIKYIWTEMAISKLGMEKDKFPPFIKPGVSAGKVSKYIINEFSINPDTEVIIGGYDYLMSLLGTGTVIPGTACDRTGTSEGINYCSAKPVKDNSLLCTPHIDENFYNVSGIISASGKAIEWFKNNSPYSNKDFESVFRDAEKIKPGADRLIFIPHIAGERDNEYYKAGAFLGLTVNHSYKEMARAVIESIGYAVNFIIEKIEKHGLLIKDLRIAGSLSKINLLNRIKADITGKNILIPQISDSELHGNACVGLTYLGEYDNIIEASLNSVIIEKSIKPDNKLVTFYREMFDIYKSVYNRTEPIIKQLYREN